MEYIVLIPIALFGGFYLGGIVWSLLHGVASVFGLISKKRPIMSKIVNSILIAISAVMMIYLYGYVLFFSHGNSSSDRGSDYDYMDYMIDRIP